MSAQKILVARGCRRRRCRFIMKYAVAAANIDILGKCIGPHAVAKGLLNLDLTHYATFLPCPIHTLYESQTVRRTVSPDSPEYDPELCPRGYTDGHRTQLLTVLPSKHRIKHRAC